MFPKMIWANLAVKDIQRTSNFYTQLGFKPNGISQELTSFIVGDKSFVIHFFLKEILEPNTKGKMIDCAEGNEIIFTVSAESKEQANSWAKEVEQAGGTLISQPEEFGDGYYGFVFADPDGHKFNVFYMKGLL